MINFIAKFIAKIFIKKPKKTNPEDLRGCVKRNILTEEEMLRICKDRAIRSWEKVAKEKKKR